MRSLTLDTLVARLKRHGYTFNASPTGVVTKDPMVAWEVYPDGELRLAPQLIYAHDTGAVTKLLEQVSRDAEDLRHCPFCGNEPTPRVEQKIVGFRWYIVCDVCSVRTDSHENMEAARSVWNRHP
jgi:hypothetical protein